MAFLARSISWLNTVCNGLFALLDKPMTVLPAWLSLTVISAVLGVVLLILFKYTSNQTAIGRVRDTIKARLLAMKLFKDNIPVVLKSQGQIFAAVIMLLVYSIPPILVMILPFCLILGQLGLWYQSRPLNVDEQAVVVMQLSGSDDQILPEVLLVPNAAAQVLTGPVRVPSKRQIFWQIQTVEAGNHALTFKVDNQLVQKQLAVGDGLMRISIKRPGLDIADLILHPAEKPFPFTDVVQSINITYPDRLSKVTGTDFWIISLFVISMVIAFICKSFFNVKI